MCMQCTSAAVKLGNIGAIAIYMATGDGEPAWPKYHIGLLDMNDPFMVLDTSKLVPLYRYLHEAETDDITLAEFGHMHNCAEYVGEELDKLSFYTSITVYDDLKQAGVDVDSPVVGLVNAIYDEIKKVTDSHYMLGLVTNEAGEPEVTTPQTQGATVVKVLKMF